MSETPLPTRSQILAEFKENPGKALLCALLSTEPELLWKTYDKTQDRVASWLTEFNNATHSNCDVDTEECQLCADLFEVLLAEDEITKATPYLHDVKDVILTMIEVMLLTQPTQRSFSQEEVDAIFQNKDVLQIKDKLLGALTYEDAWLPRIERWQQLDVQVKTSTQEEIQHLLSYIQSNISSS